MDGRFLRDITAGALIVTMAHAISGRQVDEPDEWWARTP